MTNEAFFGHWDLVIGHFFREVLCVRCRDKSRGFCPLCRPLSPMLMRSTSPRFAGRWSGRSISVRTASGPAWCPKFPNSRRRERSELTRKLPEFADGRGAVFVSVGAESTRQAVLNAQEAAAAGCDAVMAVPPMTTAVSPRHLTGLFPRDRGEHGAAVDRAGCLRLRGAGDSVSGVRGIARMTTGRRKFCSNPKPPRSAPTSPNSARPPAGGRKPWKAPAGFFWSIVIGGASSAPFPAWICSTASSPSGGH